MRIPIVASIIAIAAILTMIGLGIWQLERKGEKDLLLAQYEGATNLASVAYPDTAKISNILPLFRLSQVECKRVLGWRNISGANDAGEAGFAHLATCETTRSEAIVAVGWSKRPENPAWTGGTVSGIIGPHKPQAIKLVVTDRIEGFGLLAKPSPANIPNNHLLYAIQWFIFASAAAIIYGLALRSRMKSPK
jgi:surfeit locus 1 family protein